MVSKLVRNLCSLWPHPLSAPFSSYIQIQLQITNASGLAASRAMTDSAGKKLHNPAVFIFPRPSFERSAATEVQPLHLPKVHLEGMTPSLELGSCCCSQCTSERRMNGCWQGLSSQVIPLLRLSIPLKTKASLVLCSGNGKGAPNLSRICLWSCFLSPQNKTLQTDSSKHCFLVPSEVV